MTYTTLPPRMRDCLWDSIALLYLKLFYVHSLGLNYYSINSLLYLRTTQDKYISLYRELISQLCMYTSAIRILAKGYLPNILITPKKATGDFR